MVPQQAPDEADAMTTTPPPPPPPPAGAPSDAADAPRDASDPAGGPRVSGPEMRNLAALRRSRSDKKVAGVAVNSGAHLYEESTEDQALQMQEFDIEEMPDFHASATMAIYGDPEGPFPGLTPSTGGESYAGC